MAANRTPPTFLNWTATRKTEAARKEDLFRRHQHIARVNHQLRKDNSKPAKKTSEDGFPQLRALLPRSVAQKVKRVDMPAFKFGSAWLEPPLSPACIDPFNAFCVQDLSGQAQDALKFLMIHSWPIYAGSRSKDDVDKWVSATMKSAIECRPLLNSLIYGASSYQCYFSGRRPSANMLLLQSFQETLRTLQEELAKTETNVPEAILLTIAVLAMHGSLSAPRRRVISTEPDVRDNYFYSSTEWEPAHVHALLSLTAKNGGLSKLRSFSVAGIIFAIDTQYAATVLRRPFFQSPIPPEPYIQKLYIRLDSSTQEKLDNLEKDCLGFAFLKTSTNGHALHRTVLQTWTMLEYFDYLIHNPTCGIDLYDIISLRRLLQHAAVSLDPGTDTLYELSRRAIIAFISDCLSPLYPGTTFHQNNAGAIKTAILRCIESGHARLHPELMLWAIVLGGYIARETPLRSWYIHQLQSTPIAAPSGAAWPHVQTVSEQHLPFRFEPGRLCLEFWNEACALSLN